MSQQSVTVPEVAVQRWVLAVASGSSLLVGLDALVVSTAATTVRADLGATPDQLQWMVNAYTLAFAVLLMPASALGDRFGRRRMFTTGLVLFVAASCACALATAPGPLIAARAVQGVGAAFVMPLALALLTAAFAPADRPRALGVFAATTGASVPLGPLIGGAVVQGVSWPWIFWLNVPLGLGLAVAALRRVPESAPLPARIDAGGVALVAVGALGVVWGLVRGNTVGWTGGEVLAALAVGLVGIAGFAGWEARMHAPMLPLDLFRNRGFSAGSATIFFLWGSALGAVYFMAQFLQTGQGDDALGAGVRLLPWGLFVVLVPRVVMRLVPRFGAWPFAAGGALLHAASLAALSALAAPDRAYAALAVPLALSGTGVAMAIPAAQALALGALAGPRIGTAAGAFSMLRQLGGAAGVAAAVAAFGVRGGYASPGSFTDGFAAAVAACAGFAVAAGLAGLTGRPSGRLPAEGRRVARVG